jgi:DNA-nicking Smr family endonuclease
MSSKKEFSIHPFEKLNKKIASAQAVPPLPRPRQKKKEQYTEEELFSREMQDVLVIDEFRSLDCAIRPRKFKQEAASCGPDQEPLSILREIATGERPIHLPVTQEYVEWIDPAFRVDIIQNLHTGSYAVQAFLDLHGCTVPEAEEDLDEFMQESFKKGRSCLKIIHGRGLRSVKGARLKNAVVKRLSGHFRRNIIAFVTARQCDGGLGALYVLLGKK